MELPFKKLFRQLFYIRPNSLLLHWDIIRSNHRLKEICHFDGGSIPLLPWTRPYLRRSYTAFRCWQIELNKVFFPTLFLIHFTLGFGIISNIVSWMLMLFNINCVWHSSSNCLLSTKFRLSHQPYRGGTPDSNFASTRAHQWCTEKIAPSIWPRAFQLQQVCAWPLHSQPHASQVE